MKTLNLQNLSTGLQDLSIPALNSTVTAIAKKTKKKRLTSGSMSYSEYCKVIAENLLKPSNKPILEIVVKALSLFQSV